MLLLWGKKSSSFLCKMRQAESFVSSNRTHLGFMETWIDIVSLPLLWVWTIPSKEHIGTNPAQGNGTTICSLVSQSDFCKKRKAERFVASNRTDLWFLEARIDIVSHPLLRVSKIPWKSRFGSNPAQGNGTTICSLVSLSHFCKMRQAESFFA